jgi:Sedlin, N-terminal conserved region
MDVKNPMLLGIAVLGKSNEPLYLRNCRSTQSITATAVQGVVDKTSDHDTNDPLGLSSMTRMVHASLPLEDQIVMHAALDCYEEKVDRNASGQMPMVKNYNNNSNNSNNNNKPNNLSMNSMPHWVGPLLHQNRSTVYGYVTATNIKFFALVDSQTDVKKIPEFMKSVHMSYIEYIMNPFFTTKGGIKSTTFDEKIRTAAETLQGESMA